MPFFDSDGGERSLSSSMMHSTPTNRRVNMAPYCNSSGHVDKLLDIFTYELLLAITDTFIYLVPNVTLSIASHA